MCKYIANIITKNKVEAFSEFVFISNEINENVDLSLPTLIIGWEETKTLYPEANILNWKIKDNLYWTFSPRERRYKFEEDYELFRKKVIKNVLSQVQYQYFSIFTSSLTDIKNVIKYIQKKQSIILIMYDMIYLLYKNKIIGFSMKDAEYIGIKKEKIINLIKGNKLIFSNDFLSDVDKKTFSDSNIVIPFLYSLTI